MSNLTLIIPLYNEEKNVGKCIEVLKKQTCENFDVCFVDDGSTDNTLIELNKSLQNNVLFNFNIFKQKNNGAAAARKKGIELAKNSYVAILDCDDSISENYVESLNFLIKNNEEVDIIIPNMKVQKADGSWVDFIFYTDDLTINNREAIKNTFSGWKIHGVICMKKNIFLKSYEIYSKYNVNEQNFLNNDEVITRINFMLSSKILRVNATYFYHYNNVSTTRKINEKRYLMLENMLIMKKLFGDMDEIKSCYNEELVDWTWGTYRYLGKHNNVLTNVDDWTYMIKKVINNISYSDAFPSISMEHKIKLIILKEYVLRTIR